jgi:spore germination protein YaaH
LFFALLLFLLIPYHQAPAQSLSVDQQRELSLKLFRQQWEELKGTPAFQPAPFVAGTIRPLDPSVAPRVRGTVFGYYAAEGIEGINFELLSHLALAFVDADADGTITPLPLSSHPPWYEAINAAHDRGVRVVLVVRNNDFDSDVLSSILRNEGTRARLINNMLEEVERHSLDGVSVDFENVYLNDRDFLTLFMTELAQTFRSANPAYHISLATPAYNWGDAFDFAALSQVSDSLLMMQYVYFGAHSGNAGPQAPIERTPDLKSLLDSIQTQYLDRGVPPDKLVLLMPYYGYQWVVKPGSDNSQAGAPVVGLYRTVLIEENQENPFPNMTYDDSIDLRGQYFHYLSVGGIRVQGWSDEASSIGKKANLAIMAELQGVGIWRLEYGSGYPGLWDEIEARFSSLGRADLEVSGIDFASPPMPGVRTTAVARLTNVGRAPSGVFNVKWFLDGEPVAASSHTSLGPGEVSNGNIRFDWTPTPGVHTLRFDADVDNQALERNEGNNSATVTVWVTEGPTHLTATADANTLRDRWIQLQWDQVRGSVTYNVYRSQTSPVPTDNAHRIASGLQSRRYRDRSVSWETTYYYVVTAVDNGGTSSPPSGEASARLVLFQNVRVAPNPFTPDGDGVDDVTRIAYTLALPPQEDRVAISAQILDSGGNLVQRLEVRPPVQGSGRHSVRWNGRRRDGTVAVVGLYTFRITARSTSGGPPVVRRTGEVQLAPSSRARGFDPATFTATFYNGTDLTGTSFPRPYTEPIDFLRTCWDEGPPYAGCKLVAQLDDGNDYSVQWNGRLIVPATGEYVFIFANVDDGARLFLDGAERADNGWYWPDPDRRPSPRRIWLTAGWHNIRIDYEQRVYAAASLQVRWSGPGFAEEVIPLAGAGGVTPVSSPPPQPIASE